MAEDSNAPAPQQRQFDSGRQGRGPQREPGGFRIRLSDNEMRAVRAVQDAFQLRSPVAALGFSVRSLAQLLEEGKLDELVVQQRQQAGSRPGRGEGARGEGGRGDGPRRSGRPFPEGRPERGPRIDPLARPPRPAAVAVTEIAVTEVAVTEGDGGEGSVTEVALTEMAVAVSEAAPAAEADAATPDIPTEAPSEPVVAAEPEASEPEAAG